MQLFVHCNALYPMISDGQQVKHHYIKHNLRTLLPSVTF